MDLAAAAAGEGGDITADQAGHTTDEGAENVDREDLHEARNRMNEILSNSNPRKFLNVITTRGFSKHRRPTKHVGFFAHRGRLLFYGKKKQLV